MQTRQTVIKTKTKFRVFVATLNAVMVGYVENYNSNTGSLTLTRNIQKAKAFDTNVAVMVTKQINTIYGNCLTANYENC